MTGWTVSGAVVGGLAIVAFAALWLVVTPPAGAAECGEASFYAEQHQGKPMANGHPFDLRAMTAASWSYPLGTRVIVRNVQNGRSVQITVTDRGPAHRLHRVIDLSKAAFAKLAPTAQGIIRNVCIVGLK